ncbi:MAG: molybdenum ABC transporter ATP-binding protein [Betaproteobacteria bacterium]
MTIAARFRLNYPGFSLDVALELPSRGVTALFGPSGSGKTSLLRCFAGLERAAGSLRVKDAIWQDENTFLPPHRRPIGMVFQEASLFPHLSVAENLRYGWKRLQPAARRVAMEQAVELLGIAQLLPRMPEKLSGGERQRVAIARALLASPELLLLDEPLAALDQARKNEILPYLDRLHDELDIPMLYVSHAPDEVARLADHLVVLEAGRVMASGPLAETLARIDLPIRLGEDAGVVLEGTVVERDEQWHLVRVAFPGGNLWVRDDGTPLSRTVRLRILARDVSIALAETVGTSFLNVLPATVAEIAGETHPAVALVRLSVGDASIVARLTRRSAAALAIEPGRQVWIQIKAVALIA